MRDNRVKFFLLFVLIVFSVLPSRISNSRADVVEAYIKGTGNFLPAENCSLIMTNASVVFNIEHRTNRIYLGFEGNYTIYNPNESLNITLVAPFSTDFSNLESTCMVKVGGNDINISFIEVDLYESSWEQYFESSPEWSNRRKFVVINTTVAENSSIELEYSFDAYTVDPNSVDVLEIYYDVGTSRAWNGSITERVEFRVHGKLPDSYSNCTENVFDYNCTIKEIEDGKSYAWEWLNKVITTDSVSIEYRNPWRYILGRILPFIIIPSVWGTIIILIVIIRRRVKRRRAERKGSS